MRRFTILAAFSAAATLSLSASADVITDWNGAAIPDGVAKVQGVALGAAAAAAILDARKADVLAPEPAPAPFLGEESVGDVAESPKDSRSRMVHFKVM